MRQATPIRLKHGQNIREMRGFGAVRFAISEFDRPRPGLYDSAETASLAFDFADDELVEIQRGVVRGYSENFRPIAASDLETYRAQMRVGQA